MRLARLAALALLLAAFAAPAALADVIDPTEEACQGKDKGDACSAAGVSGTCQDDQCCRLDYGNWTDQDASPPTVCNACLTCQSGNGGGDVGSGADAGSSGGSSSGCHGTANGPLPGLLGLLAGLGLIVALRRE